MVEGAASTKAPKEGLLFYIGHLEGLLEGHLEGSYEDPSFKPNLCGDFLPKSAHRRVSRHAPSTPTAFKCHST